MGKESVSTTPSGFKRQKYPKSFAQQSLGPLSCTAFLGKSNGHLSETEVSFCLGNGDDIYLGSFSFAPAASCGVPGAAGTESGWEALVHHFGHSVA